ncbi:MAG: ABC transporter ATP-binding protein [Promethearchaeota archaeon]
MDVNEAKSKKLGLNSKVKDKFQINSLLDVNIQKKEFRTAKDEFRTVLKNLSFTVNQYDFISIIGPSGCGKSTLLRLIAGFDENFNGEIKIASRVSGNKGYFPIEHRLGKIGYIPQDYSLFPWLTVHENIRFGLKIKKIPREDQDPVIDRLLNAVHMQHYRKYYPKEISGGMKQKIAICRALAVNPESNLILMDEPFSALDAQTRNSIQSDLLEIWQNQKLTIIFVTHNIDEALFLSTKILVMGNEPATFIHQEEIYLPRERDRTSPEFNEIRRRMLYLLHVAK